MALRRIGTTTKVHKCGHCGKTGLARTVVFQRADRSRVYLGSDCAKNRGSRDAAAESEPPYRIMDRNGRVLAGAESWAQATARSRTLSKTHGVTEVHRRTFDEKYDVFDYYMVGQNVDGGPLSRV